MNILPIVVESEIPTLLPDDVVELTKNEMKKELFYKLSKQISTGQWLAIKLNEVDSKEHPEITTDPMIRKMWIDLELKQIENEYVKIVSPITSNYKSHKGFFKKLKLLFSRKVVYTDENN